MESIRIRGARTHNLKNINLEIPRNKLVVITGLSGSGKSSLAFDTLYAEGQRRYVESLSSYARQFLQLMAKPDVDLIEGLSPAIAIEQKATSHNPRSTVGTVTEIHDYLRLLFARAGDPYCPEHDIVLRAQSISQMVDHVLALPEGTRIMILSPLVVERKGEQLELFDELRAQGFVRLRVNGKVYEMDSLPALQKTKKHTVEIVVSGNYFLSGYANIEIVDRFDAPTRLDLDDLSLFAGGRVNQWLNPFTEVELSKHTLIRQGGGATHGDVIVERFYNDAILSEHDTLRVGKTLTPLGSWNLVHAAPLIPLITRPYSTARGFDAYTSSIGWLHDFGDVATADIQLYWEPGRELFKRPVSQTQRNFNNVSGGHINIPLSLIEKIGVSFQSGQLIETGETYTLYGFNANKVLGKLKLESEAVTARFSGAVLPGATRLHDNESGIFALADYAFTSQWHGILEGEYYQDHLTDIPSRSTSVAVNYKPGVPMIWKLEYIHQAGASADEIAPIHTGLKASFSTLF